MTNYISVIVSLLATSQLFFVSMFLFFHKKGNRRNNSLLGILFLLFAISAGNITFRITGIETPSEFLYMIDDGFFYLYGPLLYFYVLSVIYADFKFRTVHLVHFIPYLIHLIYIINLFFALDSVEQNQMFERIATYDFPFWNYLVLGIIFIYLFIYLWFSYRRILIYRSIIKDKFSSVEGINLNWLSFIIKSFAIINLIAMIHNVIPALGNDALNIASLFLLSLFTLFFIIRVLIKALNQSEIFSGIELSDSKKYSRSNLSREEISYYSSKLIAALEGEKQYLNPELSIKDLAAHLETSTKVISQVINQNLNTKFFDFINSYRCEEVKRILQNSDEKVTIIEAMYQSGFNSKSSFNKEFKKLTGQTPTEYKKSIS